MKIEYYGDYLGDYNCLGIRNMIWKYLRFICDLVNINWLYNLIIKCGYRIDWIGLKIIFGRWVSGNIGLFVLYLNRESLCFFLI